MDISEEGVAFCALSLWPDGYLMTVHMTAYLE